MIANFHYNVNEQIIPIDFQNFWNILYCSHSNFENGGTKPFGKFHDGLVCSRLFVRLCVFLLASSWPVKNARRQQTLKAPVPVLQLEE